jgi:WD40 repeat protein
MSPAAGSALLAAHRGPVAAVAFSADGTLLASGGKGGLVKLWDLPDGREKATLQEHRGEVTGLAFSPDGKTLATASADQSVILWEVAAAAVRSRLSFGDTVLSVAFADAGSLIACTAEGECGIWDIARGEKRGDFRGGTAETVRLAVSPDGRVLAGLNGFGMGDLWDLPSRAHRANFPVVGGAPHRSLHLGFSPNGNQLVAGNEGRVALWDLADWRVRKPVGLPPQPVHTLAFLPDGHTLLTAGTDQWARVRLPLPWGGPGYYDEPAQGATADVLRLWDTTTGRQTGTLPTGNEVALYSLAVSPDGRTVAAGGEGGMLWLWDRPRGEIRPPLFVSQQAREYWEMVEVKKRVKGLVPFCPILNEYVAAVAFSPDGTLLATASEDNAGDRSDHDRHEVTAELWTVKLWDVVRGKEVRTLPQKQRLLGCLAFSPDGRTLVTNHGAEVQLWDPATGHLRQRLEGHTGVVRCAAFAPDGRILATGGRDGRIHLWDLQRGQVLSPLLGHTDAVVSLAFSPDGRTLASGGWDGKVRLWSVAGAQQVITLEGHSGKVRCVAFAPDGQVLASAGEAPDGRSEVYLWRASANGSGRPEGP